MIMTTVLYLRRVEKNLEAVTARKGVGTFTIHIEGRASHAGNEVIPKGIKAKLRRKPYQVNWTYQLTRFETWDQLV